MKPNKLILGGIFASALIGTSIAYAAPGPQYDAPYGHPAHHMWRGGDRGAAPPQFRHLALTQKQRNEIFNIKYQSMPKMRRYHLEMRATRIALRAAATSGPKYNEVKVRKLADKLGKLQADIAVLRANDHHKVFAVLTAQQRAQIKHMREWRADADHGMPGGPIQRPGQRMPPPNGYMNG